MKSGSRSKREVLKRNLLGQILVNKRLVSNQELREALEIQKKEKALLGDILIQLGYINEETLSIALAIQTDLCYIPVEKYRVSKAVLKLVPRPLVNKHNFLPIEKIDGVLTIAVADPFDGEAIREIEEATHFKISCLIGSKAQIKKLIQTHYRS